MKLGIFGDQRRVATKIERKAVSLHKTSLQRLRFGRNRFLSGK
jgi:hypothetical protein